MTRRVLGGGRVCTDTRVEVCSSCHVGMAARVLDQGFVRGYGCRWFNFTLEGHFCTSVATRWKRW